jgi:hypothetical protein
LALYSPPHSLLPGPAQGNVKLTLRGKS